LFGGAAALLPACASQHSVQDEIRGRVSAVNFPSVGASNVLGEFESAFTAAN